MTMNLIEKINEFAGGAQRPFRELVTDLSKFNDLVEKKLAIFGQLKDELVELFTQFEQEHAQKVGNQFKIFECTNWKMLQTLDVKAMT